MGTKIKYIGISVAYSKILPNPSSGKLPMHISIRILRILFLVFVSFSVFVNFISLLKIHRLAVVKEKFEKYLWPGYEFTGFRERVIPLKRVGYLTNKDMSAERNDGQFLAAQYTLAPVVLDLNNDDHRWLILDCTSLMAAFDIIQEVGAVPIYINGYSKVLAEKRP